MTTLVILSANERAKFDLPPKFKAGRAADFATAPHLAPHRAQLTQWAQDISFAYPNG